MNNDRAPIDTLDSDLDLVEDFDPSQFEVPGEFGMTVEQMIGRFGTEVPASIHLDPGHLGQGVADVTFAQSGEWAAKQIASTNLADAAEVLARIRTSEDKLENLRVCAEWPRAASAHLQLIHQLRGVLARLVPDVHAGDMALGKSGKWAHEQAIKTDFNDPFALADKIAEHADRLANLEGCRQFPISALARRRVLCDLSARLNTIRPTVH